MKIVITSGYFNPLHTGHVSYLRDAADIGDKLIVIVNNDKQVELKGSKVFMNETDRSIIVGSLKYVDYVYISCSTDGSVCEDLCRLRAEYPNDCLIFAKGGDRTKDNIPEVPVCESNNILMVFDVGCKKVTSSSEILKLYNTI